MKAWSVLVFFFCLVLVACNTSSSGQAPPPTDGPSPTPTQIAANLRTPRPTTLAQGVPITATPIVVVLGGAQNPSPTSASAFPSPGLVPTLAPVASPTSNAAELQALAQNPTLVLQLKLDTPCFLAEEPIGFRLEILSLETAPIYFYREGQWQLSLNNSPLGPSLAPRVPSAREEFVDLLPKQTLTRQEEDLGLWVMSLGPEMLRLATSTGLGLPAGDYWVTFVYRNDQDGLTEQFDGRFLIDRAAWRGVLVAPEVRFKVVTDLTAC